MTIDPATLAFIREHIRSVWALEQLLLMRRQPERRWLAADLVKELRASTPLVEANLAAFERAGVALKQDDGSYRFAPATPVLAKLCDEIETAYRERPVAMINAISSTDRLQDLADAFKLRKDPPK